MAHVHGPNDFTIETLTIEGQLFGERARKLLGLNGGGDRWMEDFAKLLEPLVICSSPLGTLSPSSPLSHELSGVGFSSPK